MPRGRQPNGEKKSATERRQERIAARLKNLTVKEQEAPDELFEKAANVVGRNGRTISGAIRDWMYGEIEAEDLMLRLQVGYKDLQGSLSNLAAAEKLLNGK